MVKFKTYWGKITEVIVERETEDFVWIDGDRVSKETKYVSYHNTWAQAKAYLLEMAATDVKNARAKLKVAEEKHEKIKAMKWHRAEDQ